MSVVIKVENLSKYYRLGLIGGGTLREDVNRWWARVRGKPDPFLQVGEENHCNRKDGEIWALRDVSFEVKEGEILGIIGRNGAGKSTLLKILSRITAPTSGRAVIRGRAGSLLEVGTGFHPELTGRENIYLNGTILGMKRSEVERKLEEIVEFAEMGKFIDTPVKRYSSGMTVRLAFAVAAHLEPEILIVDEVLAVGDAAFQKKCLGKMGEVAATGRTILFVSHNMGSVARLTSRCILMEKGVVGMDGLPDKIIDRYVSMGISGLREKYADLSSIMCGKIIRWHSISLLNENGEPIGFFYSDQNVKIRIKLEIKEKKNNLKIGFYVRSIDGQILFYSFHNDISDLFNELEVVRNPLVMTALIPGGLLNDGTYHIGICATIHGESWICKDIDVLRFTVLFNVVNIKLKGPRPGIIAPIIEWDYQYEKLMA